MHGCSALQEGNTIPFIATYRKEVTGMTAEQLHDLQRSEFGRREAQNPTVTLGM